MLTQRVLQQQHAMIDHLWTTAWIDSHETLMGSTLGISVPGGTRLTTASVLHGLIVCACTLLVACWVSVLEPV